MSRVAFAAAMAKRIAAEGAAMGAGDTPLATRHCHI
jgi:hypothetical protein